MDVQIGSICGFAKCGTTWLTHALSIHPEIMGLGECDFIAKVLNNYPYLNQLEEAMTTNSAWTMEPRKDLDRSINKPNRYCYLTPEHQERLKQVVRNGGTQRGILQRFFNILQEWKPESKILIGKGARQIEYVDTFRKWLPESKLMFITRDGRDAAISYRNFDIVMKKTPAPLATYVKKWYDGMKELLLAMKKHDILLLTYEDMSRDFRGTIGKLLEYLEVSADDDIVTAMQAGSSFKELSGREPGQENEKSIFRKGVVGDWASKFDENDVATFKKLAGDMLIKLGYEDDMNWSLEEKSQALVA